MLDRGKRTSKSLQNDVRDSGLILFHQKYFTFFGDVPLDLLTYQNVLFYWVSFIVQISSSRFLLFQFTWVAS